MLPISQLAGIIAAPSSSPSVRLVISGPQSGLGKSLSGIFTVSYVGTLTGTVEVTPSDGAGGEFFTSAYHGGPRGVVYLSPTKTSSTFYYAPSSNGVKTITLSNNAGATNPAGYTYTATADSPGSSTPFRLVRAGTTIGSYSTLQRVKDVGGWQAGDVVKCTGGTYVVTSITDPGCTFITDNVGGVQTGVGVESMTIEWETPGNPMILDYSYTSLLSMWGGGQPQLLTMGINCHNLTIRGLHFRGARTPFGASWLGSAIWTLTDYPAATGVASTLTIEYCKFWQNADGIKTRDHHNFSTYIRYCVFEDNSDNRGLDHDIYTGRGVLTHVEGCTFRKTVGQGYPQNGMGHFIKSRCRMTTVKGCYLNGYMDAQGYGGVAQSINTPNGGVVSITGNVINHYGSLTNQGNGEPLRYGDDQHTATVDTSTDPSLTTHSILFAQNTIRQFSGRPDDGSLPRVISIYPTGVPTTLLSGTGSQIPVTAVVRNNIVGSQNTTRLAQFLSAYPNNTSVPVVSLSDTGLYSGSTVPGNPAINDADSEWVGDFAIPLARSDTNQGARTAYTPSWVPTVPWQWTDIPGTVWSNYIKSDGTGLAPAVTGLDPGPSRMYAATWDYSGPTYSKKNHEFWMFGGGHAATTINILTRFNLHKESPDVTMVSAPTSESDRRAWVFNQTNLFSTAYFPSDGKPYSPHSYWNNQYIDSRDEFISFGIAGLASSTDGSNMSAGGWSRNDVAGFPRNGTWRPAKYYADIPIFQDGSYETSCARVVTNDGAFIYFWPKNRGLQKYTFATNSYSTIGGTSSQPSRALAISADDTMTLHVEQDSNAGWVVESYSLATGIRTNITVSGYAIPAGLICYGVEWVSSIGKYVTMWVNVEAYNGGSADLTVTNVVVATLELSSPTTATAVLKVLTGNRPTKCGTIRGMFYDPAYDCILVAMSHSTLLKAIKVS